MCLSERRIEAHLVRRVRSMGGGWDTYKFTSPGRRGVPDRIVISPIGRIWFVELKSSSGRLRPWQKREHEKLRRNGCQVLTLKSKEQIDAWIDS